jgi:anti-sigma-K factor RskA
MNGGIHIALEDLAFYAMGNLRGEELTQIHAHLQSCSECREELSAISGDLSALAASVEQHPVPLAARQRFLNSIGTEVPAETVSETAPEITPFPKTPSRTAWLPWTIAAALGIGAAGLGVKVNTLREQLHNQSQLVAQAQEESVRSQRVVNLLKSPGAQRATLTAAKTPVEPTGHAIYLADRGELIFQGNNLKRLPQGKAYELWVIPANGTAPLPAGVFAPDQSGDASVVMPPLPPGIAAKAFAVTVERAEGSAAPSGTPVMSGVPAPGE